MNIGLGERRVETNKYLKVRSIFSLKSLLGSLFISALLHFWANFPLLYFIVEVHGQRLLMLKTWLSHLLNDLDKIIQLFFSEFSRVWKEDHERTYLIGLLGKCSDLHVKCWAHYLTQKHCRWMMFLLDYLLWVLSSLRFGAVLLM